MTNNTVFWKRFFTSSALVATLLFLTLAILPDDAEAGRFGGGRSFGFRGSQSSSAPRSAPQQRSVSQTPSSGSTAASPARSGFMGGMMGGFGGILMGGMLGALLFGGMGGGFGLLEVLLLGGLVFFLFKMFKNRASQLPQQAQPAGAFRENINIPQAPTGTSSAKGSPFPLDEVTHGVRQITASDATFREDQFLEGARYAFDMLQAAWSTWQIDRLQSLVTQPMWGILQAQDKQRRNSNQRDITENIQYQTVEISQVWQEAGQDWITVHYVVNMLEYATNEQGHVVEGSNQHPVTVEEYWTFCRQVGSTDPNWLLSAIQQPGEVVRGAV